MERTLDMRACFNDGRPWPRLFSEGYMPTDKEFKSMRAQYVQYFNEERLRRSLVLVQSPDEKSFVRFIAGSINPDKTITIHGQLFLTLEGTHKSMEYPLISSITLISPAEVQPLDAQMIQKMYTEALKKREKAPKLPPPLPMPSYLAPDH